MDGGTSQICARFDLGLSQPGEGQAVSQHTAQLGERRLAARPFVVHALPPDCSSVSIFVQANHGEHRIRDLRSRQHPTVCREYAVTVAVVVVSITTLVVVVALLAAAGAAKLARLDGASYPTALKQAATAFAAVLTLAAAVTAALAAVCA
ncbi:hypothetical protein ABT040_16110 [Streptomyces sp. NPDC002688]|uniref:hypothetical protein n=1 Tax=Streptomyces sp. NPDC002688 TaxID=3154423 RepID=UPI00332091D3